MNVKTHQRGFTLIELVISFVIIGIAVGGVLLVINRTVLSSADPMITHQATAIAEAYMDEILTKGFVDPDGSEAGEDRATWDDVDDYAAIVNQSPPRDQNNASAGAALAGYSVTVVVGAPAIVAGSNMALITVTVTGPAGVSVALSAYRAGYP